MEFIVYGALFLGIIGIGSLLIYCLTWLALSFRKVGTFIVFWIVGCFLGVLLGVILMMFVLQDEMSEKAFIVFSVTFGFLLASIYQTLSGWKYLFERTKDPFAGVSGASNIDFGSILSKGKTSDTQTSDNYTNSNRNAPTSSTEKIEGKGGQSAGGGATGDW